MRIFLRHLKKSYGTQHRIGKGAFTKSPLSAIFFNQFCPKSTGFLPGIIPMTVPSLKTTGQSNLDLERTQALKWKQDGVKVFFFKSCPP